MSNNRVTISADNVVTLSPDDASSSASYSVLDSTRSAVFTGTFSGTGTLWTANLNYHQTTLLTVHRAYHLAVDWLTSGGLHGHDEIGFVAQHGAS